MAMKRILWALLLAALLIVPNSMSLATITATPVFCQAPVYQLTAFVQGTDVAGTYKTTFTGGANGSKIHGIYITSNDTAATHLATLQVSTSTTAHCSPQNNCGGGTAVTIPINAGFATGIPAINMMSTTNWPGLPRDSDGNPFIYLSSNSMTVEATFATGLTASTQVAINVVACNF